MTFGTTSLASPLTKANQKPASVGALSACLRTRLQGMEPSKEGQKSSIEANRELQAQYPYTFS